MALITIAIQTSTPCLWYKVIMQLLTAQSMQKK